MRIGVGLGIALSIAAAPLWAGAAGAAPIQVTSSAFKSGDHLPSRYARRSGNVSPPLTWTPVAGARAFALIFDDPDAPGPRPFVHWLAWNIPAGVILEGHAPAGASQGRNDFGDVAYDGPQPPSGTHHYHFRVFALDAPLSLAAGADRDALATAMRGHVIASGETVGLYAARR